MVPLLFTRAGAKAVPAGAFTASAVDVLEETHVAGLDAAVLAASDAEALAGWLRAHDFELRPSLERWAAVYVAKKWIFTAFRYARPDIASNGPAMARALTSSAVRITFSAETAVYPYLEPDDAPETPGRQLHLFVLASAKLEGALVDQGGVRRP
jgi:hypothetical protein